jgi:hypothetical protein
MDNNTLCDRLENLFKWENRFRNCKQLLNKGGRTHSKISHLCRNACKIHTGSKIEALSVSSVFIMKGSVVMLKKFSYSLAGLIIVVIIMTFGSSGRLGITANATGWIPPSCK